MKNGNGAQSTWGAIDQVAVVWLVILLGATSFVVFLPDVPWSALKADQGLATWVQSIGTLAALAFGYWYPERRIKAERRERSIRSLDVLRRVVLEMHLDLNEIGWCVERGVLPLEKLRFDEARLAGWSLAQVQEAHLLGESVQECLASLGGMLSRLHAWRLDTYPPNINEALGMAKGLANVGKIVRAEGRRLGAVGIHWND